MVREYIIEKGWEVLYILKINFKIYEANLQKKLKEEINQEWSEKINKIPKMIRDITKRELLAQRKIFFRDIGKATARDQDD